MSDNHGAERVALVSARGIRLALLAWLAMLGFDFFLHAGLLASLYVEPSPFLLPPMEAFRRIPIGYLGFLVAAALLVWISDGLGVRGWRRGVRVGAAVGGAIWVSLALGMYSISTASPILLIGWAAGQTLEMAYAGAVIGWGIESASLRRPFWIVLLATVVLVILTVALQSAGLAPAVVAG